MAAPTLNEIEQKLILYHTKGGLPRYRIELEHKGLRRHQEFKGEDPKIVARKAHAKAVQWYEMWQKRQAKETGLATAAAQTTEAQEELKALERLLEAAVVASRTPIWHRLKDDAPFAVPGPTEPALPAAPVMPPLPAPPTLEDPEFRKKLTFMEQILASKARARLAQETRRWQSAKEEAEAEYATERRTYDQKVASLRRAHESAMAQWRQERSEHGAAQARANVVVDEIREGCRRREPTAIQRCCQLVLERSLYPSWFPQTFDLQYNPTNKVVIVDYLLPSPDDVPTLQEVRYVQSRGEFVEKHLAESKRRQLYDGMIYQVALRTIHELFEADESGAIESVVFNGIVESIDRATGQESQACVASLQANRDEFQALNLAAIDPKACFKSLKGVAAAKLHSLTPVAPIISLDREDSRFVEAYAVGDTIAESDNLAAMDWEDFEHLIREIFEKEFGQHGAEVKVTRASRDAGVDAIIFDPDPLRGGKIVIQAKRYTNTVGVAAVRDLYGTLMNEGANKGILVTTSDYGPDAYGFAKGKPLTLLNGGNLLHLLERHGHKARIDLKEAKRILGE